MAGCTVAAYTVVIKDSGGENTRGMAHTTIVGGWHVVARLTNRVSTVMAGFTQFIYDAWDGVVETFCPGEGASIVAHATISVCCRVVRCFSY